MAREDNVLNVLLIGIDYFSNRCSGDKNFWHNLLPLMAEKIDRIVVISFNYRTIKVETQPTVGYPIQIHNVSPSHIGIDLRPDLSTLGNKEKCHSHFKSPPRSPLEYLFSFIRIRSLVQHLIDEYDITNIHCMDNFGPAMRLLQRWISPIPLSVSAMGYYARGLLHDRYLQLCYQKMDAIVPFSVAYRQKMLKLGLSEQQVYAVPWGRDFNSTGGASTPEERERLKHDLDIPSGCMVMFWTGFIQQIKEKELYVSLEIAQQVIQLREDVYFVFALKPECYTSRYQDFSAPRIRILPTTNETFLRLLRSAEYLLSPITNTQSIATPPLTWIEAMAIGLPIITNTVPGVDAVIVPGETGFVAESVDAIPALLTTALSHPDKETIRQNARRHVMTYYSITKSAAGYETLWRTLQAQRLEYYDKI